MRNMPTRREFLASSATTALSLSATTRSDSASSTMPTSPSDTLVSTGKMLTRTIPSLGEPMGVVGLGTWQVFDVDPTPADLAQRRDVLDLLFAAGGRMIDSSPMYGRSESTVGTLLAQMQAREKAFLATKVWTSGAAAGVEQMRASARRLQSAVIDLMQIHNLVDWRTHIKILRAGKERGTFRSIGITHYTTPALDELAAVIRSEPVDFVQMAYALDTRDAEQRLLPMAREKGVAVIVNRPFNGGTLFARVKGKPLPDWAGEFGATSWAQIFLKYLIGHPAVTCVIPGTARSDHMRDNIGAGMGTVPDVAQRRMMAKWWDAQ